MKLTRKLLNRLKEVDESIRESTRSLLEHISCCYSKEGRRFRTPAVFATARPVQVELVWYLGLVILIEPNGIRCFDGRTTCPLMTLNPKEGFDKVANWVRCHHDGVLSDEETDDEFEGDAKD